jgi:hypothetical protein
MFVVLEAICGGRVINVLTASEAEKQCVRIPTPLIS